MTQLTLVEKGRLRDHEIYYCRFHDNRMREVKVIVTTGTLSEFKKNYQCDLEMICRYGAEYALSNGVEGDIEFVGRTYLSVKKRLRSSSS